MKISTKRQSGAAMVEMAIVLPLLMTTLLGTMEFGWIGYHKLTLANATRAAARAASLRKSTADIVAAIDTTAAGMNVLSSNAVIEIAYCDPASGLCGDSAQKDNPSVWLLVGDSDGRNNAPAGSMIRVRVNNWPHEMITGSFFEGLPSVVNGRMNLSASMTMRRE